jgi:hypothetical protein
MHPQVISDLGMAVLLYRLSHAGIPFISVLKLALTEKATLLHLVGSQSDSEPGWFHSNDGCSLELFLMEIDHAQASRGQLSGTKINQANDSRMSYPANDNQLSEIFIERHQNPVFLVCSFKNFVITWVLRPFSCPNNIMPGGPQILASATPDAGIQKESHVPVSIRNGSTLSWLTSLCA